MKLQANSWKLINSQIHIFGYNNALQKVSVAINEKVENLYLWWAQHSILPKKEILLKEGFYFPSFNKYAEINLSTNQIFNLDSNTFRYTPSKLFYTVREREIKVAFIQNNIITLYEIGEKSTNEQFNFIESNNPFNQLDSIINLVQPDICITYYPSMFEFTYLFCDYIYLQNFFDNDCLNSAFEKTLCLYDPFISKEEDLDKIIAIFRKISSLHEMFIIPLGNILSFDSIVDYLILLNNLSLSCSNKIIISEMTSQKGIFTHVYVYSIGEIYLFLLKEYSSFSFLYSQLKFAPYQIIVGIIEKLVNFSPDFSSFCYEYLNTFIGTYKNYIFTNKKNSKIIVHSIYRYIQNDERGTILVNNTGEIISNFNLSSLEYLKIRNDVFGNEKPVQLTNIDRLFLF